jgi:hypothetical protein
MEPVRVYLSGPVLIPKVYNGKDKLFFMGNYEAFRKRGSDTGLFSLAPAAFQSGNFSGSTNQIYDPLSRVRLADGTLSGTQFVGNIIPASRISPTSQKLLEFYRQPTLPGVVSNYTQPLSRPQNRDQFILRMDYLESAKSSWAGRYSWGDENESTPGLNQNGGNWYESGAIHAVEYADFVAYSGTETRRHTRFTIPWNSARPAQWGRTEHPKGRSGVIRDSLRRHCQLHRHR